MPNFMLVSLNARFLLKIDLICLARTGCGFKLERFIKMLGALDTDNLHMRKQRRMISFAVTAKLISAFVFATRKVQFLFFLNPKVQASSCLLCLDCLICVGPVRKPHCWFSHEAAQILQQVMTIAVGNYNLASDSKNCASHAFLSFCACNVRQLQEMALDTVYSGEGEGHQPEGLNHPF